MELNDELKAIYQETAAKLKGSRRRVFMARVVKLLGKGGQRRAEKELGWNRGTIRKGVEELESGLSVPDNFAARGRKPAEYHLPNLLADIETLIVTANSPLSPAKIRRRLIQDHGYHAATLPTEETIRKKLKLIQLRHR